MDDRVLLKRARILVVDDEEGSRESLELILEDEYDVVCAGSGITALRRIRNEVFDLVLLDLTMPDMDGIETLKQIKSHDKLIDIPAPIARINSEYAAHQHSQQN